MVVRPSPTGHPVLGVNQLVLTLFSLRYTVKHQSMLKGASHPWQAGQTPETHPHMLSRTCSGIDTPPASLPQEKEEEERGKALEDRAL